MTIEEKAKRYDEILARATGANLPYYTEDIMTKVREFVEYLLPELKKESEDERIRKEIISAVNIYCSEYSRGTKVREDMLAWIEKRGEHANFRNKIQIGDKVTRNRDGMLVNLSQLNRVAKKDENQEYQKPADKVEPKFNDNFPSFDEAQGTVIVEKQGEKSSGKVEPKFKVGNKIYLKPEYRMPNDDTPIANTVFEIRAIDDKHYRFDSSYIFIEDQDKYELVEQKPAWTIEDAKAGDVLADGNFPFIFKKIDTNRYSYAYCGISANNDFKVKADGKSDEWTWMQDIKPATKEQRDLLFQKMHEAGYEWDKKHKQLKKIEGESAWSEEDSIMYNRLLSFAESEYGCEYDLVKWLKSLKDRVQPQPKNEWSEEDEAILHKLLAIVPLYYGYHSGDDLDKQSCISFLKSIKDRIQLKPEWNKRDEEILDTIISVFTHRYADDNEDKRDISSWEIVRWAEKLKSRKLKSEWKPSEEQMEVLVWCKPLFADPKLKGILESLIDDLKKLREE